MLKVAFHTLGCKLNFSETSTLAQQFKKRGFLQVSFQEAADVYVINTCSVTEQADKKCRKIVQDAKKAAPHSYVIVVGCYAQLKPKEVTEIPGVNAVFGAKEKFQIWQYLSDFRKTTCTHQIFRSDIHQTTDFYSTFSTESRTRAFLKIQDGCSYRCSFCTIPMARGKSRSASLAQVSKDIEKIRQADTKEIVLSGINLGDYGIIEGKRSSSFYEVLQYIDGLNTDQRFRISSIEPNLLTDEIIALAASSEKIVPHWHIPLQSGSDKILRLMRRRYNTDLYRKRIAKIRELMPSACIGVDVIVGFPSELEEDFIQTYNFLNSLDINYLHVFTYSERENTTALDIQNSVPMSVRKERSKRLRQLSAEKKEHFYRSQINQVGEVLFERENKDGYMYGWSENYIRVRQVYDASKVNQLTTFRYSDLESSRSCDLFLV